MSERRGGRLTFWATAGFVLLQIGWVVLMAPFAGIDEFDHVFRASSVADGHVIVKEEVGHERVRGDLIPVRKDIANAASPACVNLPYTRTYDCWPARDLGNGEVLIGSAASRYNPAFYVVAGLVAKPFHGNAALYAMRLTSAAICAALFALAIHLSNRWAKTVWPAVALLSAALPTTIYSSTLAAPNGINMLSGLALWAALLSRLKMRHHDLLSYVVICASTILLVNTHTLGLIWCGLTFAACACLVGPRRLVAHVRPQSAIEGLVALGALAGVLFDLAWLLLARPNDPAGPVVVHTNVWTLLPREMLLWPLQAIGAFPFRDEPAPLVTYAAAAVVLVGIIVLGAAASRAVAVPRLRLTLCFVVLTSYAVPVALTAATFSRLGLNWQGRYGMPYAVGFFLLLGLALDKTSRRARRPVLEMGVAAWVLANVAGQVKVLDHQASDPVLARTGWSAPSQALLVVLGIVCWLVWRRLLGGMVSAGHDDTADHQLAPAAAVPTADVEATT